MLQWSFTASVGPDPRTATEIPPVSNRRNDERDTRQRVVADQVVLVRAIGANALTVVAMSARGLFGVLTARLFGGPALGAFVLAATWVDLLAQVGVLGLDSGAMIRSAQAHSQHDLLAVRKIFRSALCITVAVSGVLGTGLVVLATTGWLESLPGASGLQAFFVVLAVSLPAVAVGRVSAQVARGLQVVHHDLYAQGALGTAVMIVALVAGYALGLGATSPAVAMTLGAIAGGGAAWQLTSRLIASSGDSAPPALSGASRGLVGFSLPIAAFHVVDVLAMRADVLLLSMFANRTAGVTALTLGIYCAVAEVAGVLRKFRQIFDLALTPVAARARRDTEAGTRGHAGQVGRWLVAVIGPAVCVMILGGGAVLSLYGAGFEAGASWLGVLAVATGGHGIMVALDSLLIVKKPALNLLNGVVAVALQAGVSVLLIPHHGPLGAAIAALVATAVRALMLVVEVRIIEGWWWPVLSMGRPAIATAVALLPGIVARLAWPGSTGASVAAAIFLVAYVGMWQWVGLAADDRTLIKTIRARLPQVP